jgi:chromate transporter
MTADEFNEAYALCQFLPGPNVVNLSVVFGRRIRGVPGAAVALLGLLGPPFVIVTLIAAAYAQWGEIAALQRMLLGVAAAAVGLILGTCAKMALPLFKDRLGLAPLVALATFVSIGVLRWPLYGALAVLVPLSIAIAWVRR